MLAFLPVSDITDGFIKLTEDDGLPQELVLYFETHYVGGERGQGPRRHRVEPTFPIELFGKSINGHKTMCREHTAVQRLSQRNTKFSYNHAP